ncbi:nicotinamidase-like [Pollicipes pollicipes]|uniref:nicotinamidase-like n=1 Tax=Pollicipes pollicipes TaxID=41117 RepID=UPI0018853D89|nr:nicotinamidase-like [Pollicipes pollicipes]
MSRVADADCFFGGREELLSPDDSMNACFTAFDKDRDNRLSVVEFGGLCRALFRNDAGKPYLLEARKLAEMFSVFDKNEDGYIDREEFKMCWSKWIKTVVRPVSAFVIVDVQNDFISGSLAVCNCSAQHKGEEVVPVINEALDTIKFDVVAYSMDWHPNNHLSFVTNVAKYPMHPSSKVKAADAKLYDKVVYDGDPVKEQILWPPHCIQDSWGAELHPDLKIVDNALWIKKGYDPEIDSYSAFFDNAKISDTGLSRQLRQRGVTDVFVCGIATDVCVGATAIHSLEEGFRTIIMDDACRGVSAEDIETLKQDIMRNSGVIVATSQVKSMVQGRDRRPELGYKLALMLRDARPC